MKKMVHPLKYARQKRFFLILPVIVIPFLIILFVLLGGSKGTAGKISPTTTGINVQLPDAHFKKGKDRDKLNLYELASRDSMKLQEQIKNDPYYKKDSVSELRSVFEKKYPETGNQFPSALTRKESDKKEVEIEERMEQIKKEISRGSTTPGNYQQKVPSTNTDIEKLERVARMMNSAKEKETDPELSEINRTLDKIMVIQHPEKAVDTTSKANQNQHQISYPVVQEREGGSIMLLQRESANGGQIHNAFFGLEEEVSLDKKKENVIRAIIPETQTLTSGSVIKIQLLTAVSVQGVSIPNGHAIYGNATLNNERLKIEIHSIAIGESILPVNLEVYDVDGLPGIYTPGNISREVTKESAAMGVNGLALQTLDQSVGAQAASAGIQAAKTLIGKKIKMTCITVRSGYQILLRNNSQK